MLSERVLQDPEIYLSDQVRQWGVDVAQRQVAIYHQITQGGEG